MKKKILMLAFAYRQQYHVLRAAVRAGHEVHVLGNGTAHFFEGTRFCASYTPFELDALHASLDAALETIRECCALHDIDLLMPSDSISTRLLIALKGRLPCPTSALPTAEQFDVMNDKWQFYTYCQQHQVSVPKTWLFEGKEALIAAIRAGEVAYPFIVKPRDLMGSWGLCRVSDARMLHALDGIDYAPLLVQELILGEEIDISIACHHGKISAYSIQKNGPDTYTFITHPALLEEVTRLVERSMFHGIAHIDAIIDGVTGIVYLIESNPRFWYSLFASTVAGLNFVPFALTDASPHARARTVNNQLVRLETISRRARRFLHSLFTAGHINRTDVRYTCYMVADPAGKRHGAMPESNDHTLPAAAPGSLVQQALALSAILK